jgi:maltose/maltodextrin transport system permease protein
VKKIAVILILSIVNAFVGWMATYLISTGTLPGLGVTIAALLILVDYLVLSPKAYPYRYMIPAIVLLFVLVLYPIYFTVKTAFTNFGTGHMMTREEALTHLLYDPNYIISVESSPSWSYAVFQADGDFVLIFKRNGERFIATIPKPVVKRGAEVILRRGKIEKGDFEAIPEESPRYIVYSGKTYRKFYDPDDPTTSQNAGRFGAEIVQKYLYRSEFITPSGEKITIRIAQDGKWRFFKFKRVYRLSFAEEMENGRIVRKIVVLNTLTNRPLLEENGAFYDIDENGEKRFLAGYMNFIGWKNFLRIVSDPNVSRPFLQIFWWTFTWAALSVLFTFVIGLSFALVLNDKTLRARTLYRTLLIIPWAVPAFISVLVWKNGMFNETYGIINRFILEKIFKLDGIKWFNDPFWAKVAVLTVNTWLGFPYMMTVSLGALQSIPEELYEAAQIDGANRWYRFWRITFPLLMTTVAPLLVGSFAFNFNNFVNIYLLTGGGPPIPNTTTPAGSTDILISYTYKLAFEGGRGQDFGFASAVSVIIFLIVAGISFVNFKFSGSFEESFE